MTSALLIVLGGGNPQLPITASLASWFKSDAGITLATGVSTWADQSGNGRNLTQATTTKQPAWGQTSGPNGLPAVTFDGTDDWMAQATFGLAQPCTHYLLFSQISFTQGDRIFDGAVVNRGNLLQSDDTAAPQIKAGAGTNIGPIDGPAVGQWGVVTVVFNGASSAIRTNTAAATTGNAGASNQDGMTLAADGPSGAFNLNSNIAVAEWLIYSVAHNTAQQDAIIAYLNKRARL